MKHSHINRLAMMLAVTVGLTLTGCATTRLNSNQCQQGDWQAIGYQDGLMGQPASYFHHHIKTCTNVNISQQQALWEKGRQAGIERYCTPLRAYQLGREGIEYKNVCPTDKTLDLLKAHDEGYYYYQREKDWQYFHTGYDPYWGNRWGRIGYSPNIVPDYVPLSNDTQKQKKIDNQSATTSANSQP